MRTDRLGVAFNRRSLVDEYHLLEQHDRPSQVDAPCTCVFRETYHVSSLLNHCSSTATPELSGPVRRLQVSGTLPSSTPLTPPPSSALRGECIWVSEYYACTISSVIFHLPSLHSAALFVQLASFELHLP